MYVVFLSYLLEKGSTKEPEQKRRHANKILSADIVPANKEAFLSNKHNKQQLIIMLDKSLSNAGIAVRHAGKEGDADVVIVKTELEVRITQDNVSVV